MADRSDDIKQLFAHLGLNPTDYQELRGKTKTFAKEPVIPPPAPAAVVPPPAPVPVTVAPALAPAPVLPPMPVSAPREPVAALLAGLSKPVLTNPAVSAPLPTPEATSQRWSLLTAARSAPPRVAQVRQSAGGNSQRVSVAAPLPAATGSEPDTRIPVIPPMSAAPVTSSPPALAPAAPHAAEDRPTRRLFADLNQVLASKPLARPSPLLEPVLLPPAAPVIAPEEAVTRPPTVTPTALSIHHRAEAVKANLPPDPQATVVPPKPAPTPFAPEEPVTPVSRRLTDAERQAAKGRIKLDYSGRSAGRTMIEERPESLGDVFKRLNSAGKP